MAPTTATRKASVENLVNFGDLNMYTGGGAFVPEGDYVIKSMDVVMFKGEKSTLAARLGVQVTFADLANPAEEKQQFYSMGSKVHESFQPSASGKGVVSVPGGPASTFNNQTNWALFLMSMYNSGMPVGIFQNDVSVMEGTWVHIANVPEPESRKNMPKAQTGEAAQDQQQRGPNTIAVVTEIKDDGKPWDNTGGMPEATAKPNGKAGKATPAPAAQAPVDDSDDVETTAINAIAAVLEKNTAGCPKLILQTSVFKAVNSKNPDMAQQVINTYFKGDGAVLNGLLEGLSYKLVGNAIKPVE